MNVRVTGLTKRYGRTMALDGVSLEFEPGKVIAVVGLNGAGKSTLLQCLAGLLAPTKGHVLFDGERFERDRVDLRMRFGFLPDFPLFFGTMNAIEHCGMVLRLYGKDGAGAEERVVELLRRFDVLALARKPLGMLSRGQIYKVALAALLAAGPELLLFDEPMASGMDAMGLREFRLATQAAADAGSTVIYTTQIVPVAEQFSDAVVILHKGQLHAYGPLASLATQAGIEEIFTALHQAA